MSWRASLSRNLQELRIHVCQSSAGSKGAREFILASYQELKTANPHFPLLVRECEGVSAKMIARYDFGAEVAVPIEGKSPKDIQSSLQQLIKDGETMPRSAESEGKL